MHNTQCTAGNKKSTIMHYVCKVYFVSKLRQAESRREEKKRREGESKVELSREYL